jgi:hypothetical protein
MKYIFDLKLSALVIFLLSAIWSCKKNSDGNPNGCKLTKMVIYNARGAVEDSFKITYKGDKIISVATKTLAIDFVYDTGRVRRVNIANVSDSTDRYGYDSIFYNTAGQTDSSCFYLQLSPGNYSLTSGSQLKYNSDGTLATLVRKMYDANVADVEFAYKYTRGNITQIMGVSGYDTLDITYDNNKNYFKNFPPDFFIVAARAFGVINSAGEEQPPFLFSENNVVDYNGMPVTYATDSNGRVIGLSAGNRYRITYSYDCL